METKHLTKGDAQPPLIKGVLRLYGMRFCPYDQRAKLVLDAKNVPYDLVNIKLSSKPGWFPGKVPTIELEDGTRLSESLIVAEYLDEAYPEPALYPKDPIAKALDKFFLVKYESAISNFYKFLSATENGYTPENFETFVNSLLPLEEELTKRNTKFLSGSKPGMLDLMVFPWIERAPMIGAIGGPDYELPNDKLPKLLKWRSDMLEVPSVKKSVLPVEVHKKFCTSRHGPGFYDFDFDILVN